MSKVDIIPLGEHSSLKKRALFIFPHAGGSSLYFREWARHSSEKWNVFVIEYPGNGSLIGVEKHESLNELVFNISHSLRVFSGHMENLIFMGKSMGAIVAFEVIFLMEKILNAKNISNLIALTMNPPSHLNQSGLKAVMKKRGKDLSKFFDVENQLECEKFSNSEVLGLYEHSLKGDIKILCNHEFKMAKSITCPISVLYGKEDHLCDQSHQIYWSERTHAVASFTSFHGGHFFDTQCPAMHESIEGLLR